MERRQPGDSQTRLSRSCAISLGSLGLLPLLDCGHVTPEARQLTASPPAPPLQPLSAWRTPSGRGCSGHLMVARPTRPAATATTAATATAAAAATARYRGSVVLGCAMGPAWGAGNAVGERKPGGEQGARRGALGERVRKAATRMSFATAAFGALTAAGAALREGGRGRKGGTSSLLATTPRDAHHVVKGPVCSRFGASGLLCSAATSGCCHNSGGCWELTRMGNSRDESRCRRETPPYHSRRTCMSTAPSKRRQSQTQF